MGLLQRSDVTVAPRAHTSDVTFSIFIFSQLVMNGSLYRLRAKKKVLPPPPPPPLGNFADISYLDENFKPHLFRDVCTLCSGALVSDSMLHMLLQQTKEISKWKFELQKEDIKPSNYSNILCSLHAECLSYKNSILNKITAFNGFICVT